MKKRVLLIGFYQEKVLGVRYLSAACQAGGYEPHILIFKRFHSRAPAPCTEKELSLLEELVSELDPCFIGLSVMSSLYLETVLRVSGRLRGRGIPVGWGGVFPTLEPERCAPFCDMVLRGEGERTLPELLDRLNGGGDWKGIPGLTWLEGGRLQSNPLPALEQNLDRLDYPPPGEGRVCLIEGGRLSRGDPQMKSFTYELCASRGCPFQCSYCSAVNLRRLYPGQRFVRFRGVDHVIEELKEAKRRIPHLKVVHFWDEIFSDAVGWVEEFADRYQAEIGLPFRIWGHPLKVDERAIRRLVRAGLHQIVVGIQSGSPRVRREVFHRYETQEQILECAAVLKRCQVPRIVYDLMLLHPFEEESDREETLRLCLRLPGRFELELHGLNFLPATDIVDMALKQGVLSAENMEKRLYGSLEEQYGQYWGRGDQSWREDPWIALIYLSQFHKERGRVERWAAELRSGGEAAAAFEARDRRERLERFGDLLRKGKLLLGK